MDDTYGEIGINWNERESPSFTIIIYSIFLYNTQVKYPFVQKRVIHTYLWQWLGVFFL